MQVSAARLQVFAVPVRTRIVLAAPSAAHCPAAIRSDIQISCQHMSQILSRLTWDTWHAACITCVCRGRTVLGRSEVELVPCYTENATEAWNRQA